MNNNYVHDLRNNLAAVIDELDRRGSSDRTRLAIGGHSYGAFSTVNAMVHTPFFKAGIAGDGAYNRTLTPLGFQSERRDLWEAPQRLPRHVAVPLCEQPDRRAADVSRPRGPERRHRSDQLDPAVSRAERPRARRRRSTCIRYEDHGPASKETLLDLWARWAAWLDKYVKNPQKAEPKKVTTDVTGAAVAAGRCSLLAAGSLRVLRARPTASGELPPKAAWSSASRRT